MKPFRIPDNSNSQSKENAWSSSFRWLIPSRLISFSILYIKFRCSNRDVLHLSISNSGYVVWSLTISVLVRIYMTDHKHSVHLIGRSSHPGGTLLLPFKSLPFINASQVFLVPSSRIEILHVLTYALHPISFLCSGSLIVFGSLQTYLLSFPLFCGGDGDLAGESLLPKFRPPLPPLPPPLLHDSNGIQVLNKTHSQCFH